MQEFKAKSLELAESIGYTILFSDLSNIRLGFLHFSFSF